MRSGDDRDATETDHVNETSFDRRRLLALVGSSLAVGLAGCSGDGGETATPGDTDTPTPTPTDTDTSTPTPTDTDTPTPTQTDTDTSTPTPADTSVDGTDTPGDATPTALRVEMSDELVFDPDVLRIPPGETVVFENVGQAIHSVTADEQALPEGANYWASGGFDSEEAARDAYSPTGSLEDTGSVAGSESWSHTFETEGTHEYFCIPHEPAGMVGEIEVIADTDSSPGGGDHR